MVIILIILAAIISTFAYIIYYNDIKQSSISPNRFSWIIWSISTFLEALTYDIVTNDILKSICFYTSAICCILITIKIWTTSKWAKPNWTEKISLAFCFLALLVWITFNSILITHLLLLLAIPIAFIPTYKNAQNDFHSENSRAWLLWSISDILVVLIIIIRLKATVELPYALIEFGCHLSVFLILIVNKLKMTETYIIKNNHLGKGVYSKVGFKKGEQIIEFSGELVQKKSIPKNIPCEKDYYMQIDLDFYLGPSGKADDYINHSCKPNSGLIFTDKEIYLIAIKDIKKNEEITWDYSTTLLNNEWTMNCECNEMVCRKIINGFNQLDKQLQDFYISLNIVAPYIKNKLNNNN